jgi:hypothetical protein
MVRCVTGVALNHGEALHWNTQLLRCNLAIHRVDARANIHVAGVDRDRAVFMDSQKLSSSLRTGAGWPGGGFCASKCFGKIAAAPKLTRSAPPDLRMLRREIVIVSFMT